MKHSIFAYLKIILFFVLLGIGVEVMAVDYPAEYKVTANLNIRKGPGTNYTKVGALKQNKHITIYGVTKGANMDWGEINYQGKKGYVSMNYVRYLAPVKTSSKEVESKTQNTEKLLTSAWNNVWKWITRIFKILGIIILLLFWKHILEGIIIVGVYMGIGSLITYLLFGNGDIGCIAGFCISIFLGIRYISNMYDIADTGVFRIIYNLISFPFYILNKLEFFIIEPWRYIFMYNWMNDGVKEVTRFLLYFIQIGLYVVSTPLRALNAFNYNIIIHVSIELYDLLYETLAPSSYSEGKGNLGQWLLYLPMRFIKYPLYHGTLVIVESIIWTIIDIFIPALTLYHGTDMTAGESIVHCPDRSDDLKRNASWRAGMFTISPNGWGGKGVYFASMRYVAKGYAKDPYRLSDNNPVMIACRVSLGSILNYALAPDWVYRSTGEYGCSSNLNHYAEKNGYTTGEWWNPKGLYWEFCLLDWSGPYDHPWRIRPLYIYNFRTGLFEHVKGGMQHWIFDNEIIKKIFN